MFFLDLRRASVAIASGRLDDAFDVLQNSSEVTHRDGQRLVDRLADALVARATQHLTEGRIDDARHDGRKALQLAGRKPEVTELLLKISATETERRHRQQRRDQLLASAREQVHAGAYSLGAKLLGGVSANQSASGVAATERLAESIEAKRAIVEDAASRIRSAIDAGSYESAAAIIGSLTSDQRATSTIATLIPNAIEPLVTSGLDELAAGRLDRAQAIDDIITSAGVKSSAAAEVHQCVRRCVAIRRYFHASRFAEAQAELAALQQIVSGSQWIEAARLATAEVMQNLVLVTTGPLSLLTDGATAATYVPDPEPLPRVSPMPTEIKSTILPVRSVLQVDGIGGLLLLTGDVITVGASSKKSTFDVSLMTEGPAVPLTIRRASDDYFAESSEAFRVNGQPVTRKLLTSGDSIAIGARGRLRFVKPVAASGSAVLQITGSRLSRRDVRSVVLMSDSLLFGPMGSHFRLSSAESPIVLHRGADGFALRQLTARRTDSSPVRRSEPMALGLGNSVVMNDTRFALVES